MSAAPPIPKPTKPEKRSRLSAKEALERLWALADSSVSRDSKVKEIVEVASELTGALGIVFLERDAEKQLVIQPKYYAPAHLSHLRSLLQHVMRLSTVAAAEGKPQAGAIEADANLLVVAVPVLGCPLGNEALALAISVESPSQARGTIAYLVQVMTWIAAYLGSARHNQQADSVVEFADLRRVQAMLLDAAKKSDPTARYRVVADGLRDVTGAEEVVLGFRRNGVGPCKVAGYSGHDQFDVRSGRVGVLEELLDETVLAATHGLNDETVLETQAAELLKREAGQRVAKRQELRAADGTVVGALLFLSPSGVVARTISDEAISALTQQMHWMRQAEPNKLQQWFRGSSTGKPWYYQKFIWAVAATTLLLLLMPMPLKIKTDCVVQPQQRRFVSVPYEGRLEEAMTKPGEVVLSGQLLARMDGRDIQWEISTLTADLHRAEKSRDTAAAGFETAAAQMAGFEAKRLQLQIDELNERLKNLEVRSPVDGVIVSGDPQKLEGSRFAMGDTLLEVAPLSEMLVELEIPDEDISHVRVGQRVSYRLSAMPLTTFDGVIQSIQPRSESRENANVFVGFVELANANDALRPGMRGRAKITGDRHLFGWNLFHKAWDHLVSWLAW